MHKAMMTGDKKDYTDTQRMQNYAQTEGWILNQKIWCESAGLIKLPQNVGEVMALSILLFFKKVSGENFDLKKYIME